MTRWVALLRGVNVGGATVRGAELAEVFREQGFEEVATILATGNVVFDTDLPERASARRRAACKSRIEKALADRFGYDAWIVLTPRAALDAAARKYPHRRSDDDHQPYLVFGSTDEVLDELLAEGLAAIEESGDGIEDLERGVGCLYWRVPKGRSTDTPVAKVVAKKKYRAGTTTRNLRTVQKIALA